MSVRFLGKLYELSMSSGSEAGPQSGFSMDFDPAHRVLRVSGFGVLTMKIINEADSAMRQFLADEGADFAVCDYSRVTALRVTANEVQLYAEKPAPPGRRSFASPSHLRPKSTG